jgi:hypothetical protein
MWNLLIGPISDLLDKFVGFIPNPEERQKAKLDMQAQLQAAVLQAEQSQLDIDKQEAASSSVFVAGWRPAIGWVCGVALAWQFVLSPIISYLLVIAEGVWHFTVPPLPVLDNSQLYPILMGMLGLGGLRTYEKVQGVARDNMDQPSKSTPSN